MKEEEEEGGGGGGGRVLDSREERELRLLGRPTVLNRLEMY